VPGERNDTAVRRFVEQMAMIFNDFGFPRMPARVLITLMAAEDDALSAGDLGERLDVSPAAISGAVRYLMHLGLIMREPAPGSRSDRYRLPDDAWYEASVVKGEALTSLADTAGEGAAALGETTTAGRRMAEMQEFFLFSRREIDAMVSRWRELKASSNRSSSLDGR
jgi:DNA-binding transcriptional regulator GbsR (MarR family)